MSLLVGITVLIGPALVGCGQSGPQRVLVRGKITFAGGPPPADGIIFFAPAQPAEGFPSRPGRARFTKGDGTFVVTSVQPEDGLVPGTYRVQINCWRRMPGGDGTPGVSYVPANYAPGELKVTLDGPSLIELQYDVPAVR